MFEKLLQRIGILSDQSAALPENLSELEAKIKYTFSDKNLLLQAIKHRSYLSITQESDFESNERLEFLGDAVLDLVVTEYLYDQYKTESEGDLSKQKSVLVSRQVLSIISLSMDLGKYLLINKGEEKTGGRERQSNMANLYEALLGAIYLDSNYKTAKQFVKRTLFTRCDEFLGTNKLYNYKSMLLEYAQAKGWGSPRYHVLEESGPDHDKQFKVIVNVNNSWNAEGSGKSKKSAEQSAASRLLKKLNNKI